MNLRGAVSRLPREVVSWPGPYIKMTVYLSYVLVRYQFSYQIVFHLELNQGNLACEKRLLHCTSNTGQERNFPQHRLTLLPKMQRYATSGRKYAVWINSQDSPTKTCNEQTKAESCAKYWFSSLGFKSFSSNYCPKRIWTWVTPVVNPAITADKKRRRPTTNDKGIEKTCIKKPCAYILGATGSSL